MNLPRLVVGLLCVVLVACQAPPPAAPVGQAALGAAPAATDRADVLEFGGADPSAPAKPAVDTDIRGRVDFPATFKTQATSNYVAAGAALALFDEAGATVVVGKTDLNGNFTLPLNGYNPSSAGDTTYLLEASRNLAKNAAGGDALRFRTILRWNGGQWLAITGSEIVVSALTTALALESSLDPANVKPINTISKVSYPNPLSGQPFQAGGHPDAEINGLANAILGFLAGDRDPVSSVTAIKPRIDRITPSGGAGQAVQIDGVGFSPLLSGNVVSFAGTQASIFLATPTSVLVSVPQGASSGNVTVATSLGTSAGVPFTITGSSGLAILNLVPPAARSGDTINIVGQGFSTVAAANVVTFGNNKVATPLTASYGSLTIKVPSGASSGNVSLKVGNGTSNSFFFKVDRPVIVSVLPEPFEGPAGTQVTVTGTNFGLQGPNSTLRFGGASGADAKSIALWQDGQVTALSPDPNPAKVVSGPVVIVNDLGDTSDDFGNFTARRAFSESFSTQTYFDSGQSSGVSWGSNSVVAGGEDGDLTVPGGQTRTFGTSDAPRSLINLNASAGATTIRVASAAGFVAGQEIFITQLWGTGAGNYEYRTIRAVAGTTLTLAAGLANAYKANSALVQKVPHYRLVDLSGTLTGLSVASVGAVGGFVIFRARTVVVNSNGKIDATGLGATGGSYNAGGYPNGGNPGGSASNGGGAGGQARYVYPPGGGGGGYGSGGSSSAGGGGTSGGYGGNGNGSNGGGGGSAEARGPNVPGSGGGGGYGTAGANGKAVNHGTYGMMYGRGGAADGSSDLSQISPGAGGGANGAFSTSDIAQGGHGGGVIIVHAGTLNASGIITANGGDATTRGYGGAGGGSGGAVFLNAYSMTLASGRVRANGGNGTNSTYDCCGYARGRGGDGGYGRVRLQYSSLNGGGYPNAGAENSSVESGTPKTSGNASSPLAIYTGSAVSRGYDTNALAPTFTRATVSKTDNNGSVTGVEFSTSTNNNLWSSWTSNLASVPKRRYIRWRATVTADAVINSVTFDFTY